MSKVHAVNMHKVILKAVILHNDPLIVMRRTELYPKRLTKRSYPNFDLLKIQPPKFTPFYIGSHTEKRIVSIYSASGV